MAAYASARSRFRLPLVVLALALVVAFHRLLLGEVFFWGLPSLQFVPWRQFAFEMLRSGQLPLWNPYNGAGAPLLANYQSSLLYPFTWLPLPVTLASQMSIVAVLHLFIGGAGMWLFARRLGLPELGQGISALAFGMTGYLVARLGTFPIIQAAAWIPFLLWAALGLLARGSRRDVAWLALFAALQLLAGHAQTTWYSMLLVAAFSLWWSFAHRPVNRRRLLMLIAALTLGAGVAAAQLLPTAELLAQSQRSTGVDYEFAVNFSYDPLRLPNLFSPNFFGTPADGSYITEGAFFEDAVYIGFIPVISALATIFAWVWGKLRRRERPAYFVSVPFWLVIVVVAFLLALGKHSPIFPFLYENVPTFKLFQAPVRWHIWTVFGLSLLAGIGAGVWGRGKWLFFSTRLATAASIGAVLLALAAPRLLPDIGDIEGVQVIIRAVIATGILAALAGALTLLQPESPSGRAHGYWRAAVLLVIAADLVYASLGLNPTVPASFYPGDSRLAIDNLPPKYWPEQVEQSVKFEQFFPFDDYRVALENQEAYRHSVLPNFNLFHHITLLNNFDPLQVDHFAAFIDLVEAHPDQRDHLLSAAGVYGVYNEDEAGVPEPNESFFAQVWFVSSACWYPDEAAVTEAMLDPSWQPSERVLLLGEGECIDDLALGEVDTTLWVMTMETPANTVYVPVSTYRGGEGYLVLAHTFYPGWTAFVNEVEVPIEQANLAFRAVRVPGPTGRTVRLEYRPWWLWPGVLVSVVSLLILLLLFRSRNPDGERGI